MENITEVAAWLEDQLQKALQPYVDMTINPVNEESIKHMIVKMISNFVEIKWEDHLVIEIESTSNPMKFNCKLVPLTPIGDELLRHMRSFGGDA